MINIDQDNNYRLYLKSSYPNYLSQGQEFKTHLISKDSAEEFRQVFEKFIADNYQTIYK